MSMRAAVYNSQLRQAKELEAEGRLLIIAPDDIGKMKTLTKDRSAIITLYEKGKKEAERLQTFLRD
jgi:predicted patatin/cPLA2 family phospholipase